jgi:hypothetical protein
MVPEEGPEQHHATSCCAPLTTNLGASRHLLYGRNVEQRVVVHRCGFGKEYAGTKVLEHPATIRLREAGCCPRWRSMLAAIR